MLVNSNTPDYIWRMQAARNRIEVNTMEIEGRYLTQLIEMDKERQLKVCLEEELRNLGNRYPNKQGEGLRRAFERIGDGDTLEGMCNENGKKE